MKSEFKHKKKGACKPTGLGSIQSFLFLLVVAVVIGALLIDRQAHASIHPQPIGTIYEIKETSLLEVIMARLHHLKETGEMDQMQEEFTGRVLKTIKNPPGVNLPRADHTRSRYYDPSITFHEDILLPDGEILHPAGTRINPLKVRGLSKRLIFIDQRDQEQVAWAYERYMESMWRDKVILVAGSYIDLMNEWKKPVYFDQLGVGASADVTGTPKRETMVRRFNIQSLPAIIYQEGDFLRIDEVQI